MNKYTYDITFFSSAHDLQLFIPIGVGKICIKIVINSLGQCHYFWYSFTKLFSNVIYVLTNKQKKDF